jgi:hypothetical protein
MKPNLTVNRLSKIRSSSPTDTELWLSDVNQHWRSISLGSFCSFAVSIYPVSMFKNAAVLQESKLVGEHSVTWWF